MLVAPAHVLHHEGGREDAAEQEDHPAGSQYLPLGDLAADPLADLDRRHGADEVAEQGAQGHHVGVEGGRQGDGGDLGPVAPLCQEGHHEGLCQDVGVRQLDLLLPSR